MNELIFSWLYSLAGQNLFLDYVIKFAANYLPWLLFGLLAWQLLRTVEQSQSVRPFLLIALAPALTAIASLLIKTLHYRPRPFVLWSSEVAALLPHVPDGAFPSAHAAVFAALALAVLVYRRAWGWWYLAGALVISVGRVAAGLHSPVDILGGWVLGLVLTTCLIKVFGYNRRNVRS